MLFIAMHNDDKCLDKTEAVLKENDIQSVLRVHRDKLGSTISDT